MLARSALQKFRESRVQTFCPGDPGYDGSSLGVLVLPMSLPMSASLANTIWSYPFEGVATASPGKPLATAVL